MTKKDSSIIKKMIDDDLLLESKEFKELSETEDYKKFMEICYKENFNVDKVFATSEAYKVLHSKEFNKLFAKYFVNKKLKDKVNIGGALINTEGLTELQSADYVSRISNAITEAVSSVKKVERNPNNRYKKKPLIPNSQFHDTKDFKEFFGKHFATGEGDIILDFFSGSATTAHAVMQLNAEDGGNRKYISRVTSSTVKAG